MKNIKIIIILLLLSISVKAQNVPYEKLEAFSKEISQLQFEANGLTYNDGTTDYEISFPEENFTVSISSHLATNVVYKKTEDTEVMELTENIDLSKVIGIEYNNSLQTKSLLCLQLYFPKGSLKTNILKNGKISKIINNDYITIYRAKNSNKSSLFNTFYNLCTSLKKEKGLISQTKIDEEISDYEKLTSVEFVKKHPTSLYILTQKNNIKQNEKLKLELGEKAFMNYNPSNYKLGLSVEDTNKEYPSLKLKINKDSTDELVSSDGNVKFYIKNGKVYGYTNVISLKKRIPSDEFEKIFEIGNKNLLDLETKFQFSPSIQESDFSRFYYFPYVASVGNVKTKYSAIPKNVEFRNYNFHYEDGDKISYTWNKNGKIVRLDITFLFNIGFMSLSRYGHNITITVIDENLIE